MKLTFMVSCLGVHILGNTSVLLLLLWILTLFEVEFNVLRCCTVVFRFL